MKLRPVLLKLFILPQVEFPSCINSNMYILLYSLLSGLSYKGTINTNTVRNRFCTLKHTIRHYIYCNHHYVHLVTGFAQAKHDMAYPTMDLNMTLYNSLP